MGRSACCAKEGLNRGAWTAHEDRVLSEYIKVHGEGRWRNLPERAGLKRCGKSCRLRWLNYLRPDIKRGNISQDEEELIVRLHKLLGNRWSLIAGRIPGRTDNEIKNYWNTNLRKKVKTNDQIKIIKHKHFNNTEKNTNKHTEIELYPKNSTLSNNKLGLNQIIVRTKAVKCTKNFINPIVLPLNNTSIDHEQQSHITKMSRDSGLVSIGQESNFSTSTTIPENSLCNTLFAGSDHQDNDFIMNFNVEDFCISDFLNSDYLSDHNCNTSYEGKNEILGLDGKELRFSSDYEILLQEWNGKDCNSIVDYESSNFNHQIIPS